MPFESQNKKGEKLFRQGSYVSSLGKPGVMITLWESLVSWKGQSGSPDRQEPQTRRSVLARMWVTASSIAALGNVGNHHFHCNRFLGLIVRCCFLEASICEFSRIFSLLFFWCTILFIVFLFCTSFCSCSPCIFSLAEGFLPNRFSWLNKILPRNSLLVSFS